MNRCGFTIFVVSRSAAGPEEDESADRGGKVFDWRTKVPYSEQTNVHDIR